MIPQVGLKIQGKLKPGDKELVKIVDLHGGVNCTAWSQVARIYESQVGVKVKKAYELKRLYVSFTNYKEGFSDSVLTTLFESAIETRGNSKYGSKVFEKLTGNKIYTSRYTQYIKYWLRKGLKLMRDIYMPSKIKTWTNSDYYQKCQCIPPRSAFQMLQILDCDLQKYQDDLIIMDFYKSACEFEQLLYYFAMNFNISERTEVYQLFSQIITRNKYKRIHFYAHYYEELRKINVSQIIRDDQLTQHPLLKQTIIANKMSPIYTLLFQDNDYSKKLRLFYDSNDLEIDQFSVCLKLKKDKELENQIKQDKPQDILKEDDKVKTSKINHDFIQKKTKKQKKYFRGHLIRPGTYSCKNQTTKKFDYDFYDDELED